MEAVKNRLGSSSGDIGEDVPSSMGETARAIYNESGLTGFYNGVSFSCVSSFTEKFIYFQGYNFLRQVLVPSGRELTIPEALGVGAMADWFHLPFTVPLETILVQINKESKGRPAVQLIRETLASPSGVWSYYKALPACIILCVKPAIQYAIFDRLKAMLLLKKSAGAAALSALEAFVLGALARAVATVLTFPYARAKLIKQGNPTGDTGILGTMLQVLGKDGPSALYVGLAPDLIRGVFSSALMLMCKEKIQEIIKGVLLAHHKKIALPV